MLYGCETWSLMLWEECWLRVLENRILIRILGLKRNENGEWRKLGNEELTSPNIFRVITSTRLRWAVHVARIEETSGSFKILTEKSARKRILGR